MLCCCYFVLLSEFVILHSVMLDIVSFVCVGESNNPYDAIDRFVILVKTFSVAVQYKTSRKSMREKNQDV